MKTGISRKGISSHDAGRSVSAGPDSNRWLSTFEQFPTTSLSGVTERRLRLPPPCKRLLLKSSADIFAIDFFPFEIISCRQFGVIRLTGSVIRHQLSPCHSLLTPQSQVLVSCPRGLLLPSTPTTNCTEASSLIPLPDLNRSLLVDWKTIRHEAYRWRSHGVWTCRQPHGAFWRDLPGLMHLAANVRVSTCNNLCLMEKPSLLLSIRIICSYAERCALLWWNSQKRYQKMS